MTGIMKGFISSIEISENELQAEDYIMVSVRPGEKISAMFDVFSHLFKKTPSALINGGNAFSEQLARYAASNPLHGEVVLEAVEKALESGFLSEGCALDLLKKNGVLELKNESFLKMIDPGITDSSK
ncbi:MULTISPECIES: hypothetical protein [unclassified Aeromonas]|uniref:hypothetical protein n=1 Tax=unclassified Aeromonas TaxID=257493 RepID=UPI0022E1B458|nr:MULTISPECIES: hypothetical protein [unclassified Aeromonas]